MSSSETGSGMATSRAVGPIQPDERTLSGTSADEQQQQQQQQPKVVDVTKTKQFRKAKSAATFLLDGIAYTIVASPPGTPKTATGRDINSTPSTADEQKRVESGSALSVLRRTMSGGNAPPTGCVRRPGSAASSRSSAVNVAASSVLREGSLNGSRSPASATAAAGDGAVVGDRSTVAAADATVTEAHHSCSQRLKYLLNKAEQEDIRRDELITHLEYLITVLDSTYIDEARGGFDVDDGEELSKVEAEAVPTEVRDWLAQTFTRSMASSATKRTTGDNKPKFRSVANAIRAGILVDRIYRRISSPSGIHVPPNVVPLLKNIDEWSFDVFAVNSASDCNALKYVSYELLQRYDIISKFKISIPVLESFLARVQQGYSKYSNPYHNLVHAADVTQTMHYVINRSGLSLWLTDLELFAAVFAAMIHDFEHTGTTNTFHVNTGSDVALLYNDKAVLENHHLSATFRILKEDDYNILSGLKAEEFREFRSLVIDVVLATDMSFHFQQIKNMKSHLTTPDSIDKTKALSMIVHCADISHPSKGWDLHHRWTELLIEEFFRQGDREETLGLPISPLCDRKNTLVAESQIGFIDFIVDPSMQVMGDMVEKIVQSFQQSQSNNASLEEEGSSSSNSNKINSNSTASTPADANSLQPTPLKSPECVELRRPWERCLVINKQMWKERAARGWISPLQEPRCTDGDRAKTESTQPTEEHPRSETTDEADSGVESPGPRSASSLPPSEASMTTLRQDVDDSAASSTSTPTAPRKPDARQAPAIPAKPPNMMSRALSGGSSSSCDSARPARVHEPTRFAADNKFSPPPAAAAAATTSGLRQSNV